MTLETTAVVRQLGPRAAASLSAPYTTGSITLFGSFSRCKKRQRYQYASDLSFIAVLLCLPSGESLTSHSNRPCILGFMSSTASNDFKKRKELEEARKAGTAEVMFLLHIPDDACCGSSSHAAAAGTR